MNAEELSNCWRNQKFDTQLNSEAQLKEARKRAAKFRKTILMRDTREVIACLFVASVFIYSAIPQPVLAAIGSYFVAFISVGVGSFFLVDRLRERAKHREFEETPLTELKASLDAVEHQIWLLQKVSWWYLGPFAIGLTAWSIMLGLSAPLPVWVFVLITLFVVGPVFYGIAHLNQKAVSKSLIPERDEIKRLMKQWEEDL